MRRYQRIAGAAGVVCCILLALIAAAGCNVFETDGTDTTGVTPAGGYFYLLDRTTASLIMLDARLAELKRWPLYPALNDSSLQGIVCDGKSLWIASAGSADRIVKIDVSGDSLVVLKSFTAPPSGRGTVRDLAWDGSSLWALNSGSSTNTEPATLYKLDPSSGSILAQYTVPTAEPRGMTYAAGWSSAYGTSYDAALYYTDVSHDRIWKFRTDRPVFDTAFAAPVPPRGTSAVYAVGIAYDGASFWIVNSSGFADMLFRVDAKGIVKESYELPYAQPGPIVWSSVDVRKKGPAQLLAITPSSALRGTSLSVEMYGTGFRPGTALAADFGAGVRVDSIRYILDTQLRAWLAVDAAAVPGKRSVVITNGDGVRTAGDSLFSVTSAPVSMGYLWLADQQSGGYVIHKIRVSDTTAVRSWSTTSVSTGSPQGLAFDGTNLWLCASGTDKKIYKLDTTSSILTATANVPAPATSGTLRGIAMQGGSLWLAVSGLTPKGLIYQLNPSTGVVIDSIPTPGVNPRGIAFVNGTLYCNDTDIDSVFTYDTGKKAWTSQFATPTPPGGSTGARFATGMCWDGSYFWIANSSNNYDHVFKLTQTGVVLQSFTAPGVGTAQLTGLVYTPN